MKIDPRHLEILAAIVEHGGLTEGAAALRKSQPSVSRSLAMLEERLGFALFEPGRRPLRPTEICLSLAAEGRNILKASAAASHLVEQFKSGHSGSIRLAGPPIFMDGVVSDFIAAFQSDNPNVRIDQSYGYAPEIIAGLNNGTLDIGIVPIRTSEIPEGLTSKQILKGRNVIACRVGHPLKRAKSVELQDMATYSWIAPPADSPLYHDLRSVLARIGIQDFKVSFTGGSLTSVTRILSASDSLTVLPYSVVHMLRRQNAVAALPVRIGDPDRNLRILTRTEAPTLLVQNSFSLFIEREFRSLRDTMSRQDEGVFTAGK